MSEDEEPTDCHMEILTSWRQTIHTLVPDTPNREPCHADIACVALIRLALRLEARVSRLNWEISSYMPFFYQFHQCVVKPPGLYIGKPSEADVVLLLLIPCDLLSSISSLLLVVTSFQNQDFTAASH